MSSTLVPLLIHDSPSLNNIESVHHSLVFRILHSCMSDVTFHIVAFLAPASGVSSWKVFWSDLILCLKFVRAIVKLTDSVRLS